MAEENNTAELDAPPSAPDSVQASVAPEASKPAEVAAAEPEPTAPPPPPAVEQASETATPEEPDAIQPYIDKVRDTIKLTLEEPDIGKFLRAHIKTFREEWDGWSDNAKLAYTHMMTAQFLQRRAAATEIAIGNQFKLPNPSAQTQLMASIKKAITKPPKSRPALSVPLRLRPTSSRK
jgi:hypothetical protein